MFGWATKDASPDAWTTDRQRRLRLLDYYGGDVERARAAWALWCGQRYGLHLYSAGLIGEWPGEREHVP